MFTFMAAVRGRNPRTAPTKTAGRTGRGEQPKVEPPNGEPFREAPPATEPSKGERTRALLAKTAFELFEREGFERTTLRGIGSAAGVSLGLLYRYFPSKDALVIELYDQVSLRFHERATELPQGGWATRALHLVRLSFEVLAPHRETLRAMVSSLTVPPGHPLFIPGGQAAQVRVQEKFEEAVLGATDAPAGAQRFGRQLYLAHLALVLGWLLDRSPEQQASAKGLALAERWAPLLSGLLASGMLGGLVGPVGEILEQAVLGHAEVES